MIKLRYLTFMLIACTISACQTTQEAMLDTEQVTPEIRVMQTRSFEGSTKAEVMRATIQTLQDLNFEIDDVNSSIGLVRAKKYTARGPVTVNINIQNKQKDNISVRMNANFANKPVIEAGHYNKFFSALHKSVFLENNM